MAPHRPVQQTDSSTSTVRPDSRKRTYKRKFAIGKGVKRRDGLLNSTIPAQSKLMQLAQMNSIKSPLLRLPGELRDKIWRFALGDHHIDIHGISQEPPSDCIYDIRTLYPRSLCRTDFAEPTFQLPRVCRQTYVEASSYIYTLNTFSFNSMATLDCWIKNRCVGQRRLIGSLDVPCTYTRLYRSGLRRSFRLKFPNIHRISVDNWTLFCEYDGMRRLPESKGRSAIDMWVEAKAKIIAEIRAKEGGNVEIGWHGRSA